MKKKALSLILSAAMALSLTVVPASAVSVSNFSDVSSDSWYYDSVRYVAEKDYMNGTSATTFEPNSDMTRAMFATLISRVAGAEVDNSAASEFTDVVSGQWYTGAIEWGVENELITGYGNGLFGTNDSITRQDIAVLTQRFLDWYCAENNKSLNFEPLVENFTDADSIADYAQEAVEFCREAGLLTGYEDGSFRPLGTATRAEIAAIVERIEFIMESASPAVVYTDTEGNRATLEIAAGDVITVDPNNGSVTYDGTTHRDEFTITATEEGITLPDATRSGYRFDGWKVETDANGAYTFTAQWTRTSSGGGGGTNPTPPEGMTYQDYSISFVLEKLGTSYNGNFSVFDEIDSDRVYHVAFDNEGNYLENYSEDISLTTIAKDVFNTANIQKVLNAIQPLSINGEEVIDSNGVIHEITVQQVRVADVISEPVKETIVETVQELVNSNPENYDGITADDITLTTVNNVLTALDNGVSSIEELQDIAGPEGVTIAKQVTGQLEDELKDEESQDAFVVKVKDALGNNAQELLDQLGLSDDDIISMSQEYLGTLQTIFGVQGNSQEYNSQALVVPFAGEDSTSDGEESASSVSTAGGIAVKVNPVDVLIGQYGESPDYDEAKQLVDKALEKAGVEQDDRDAIVEELERNNIFSLCDPDGVLFENISTNEEEPVWKLKDADFYEEQMERIINALNEARLQLINSGVLTKEKVQNAIESLIGRAESNVDTDSDIFDRIGANAEDIASLIMEKDPTLIDLLELKENGVTEGIQENETINLTEDRIRNILEDILGRLDLGTEITDDNELIGSLVEKLAGDYRIEISVNVDTTNCPESDIHH